MSFNVGEECKAFRGGIEGFRSSGGRLLDLAGGAGGVCDDDLSGNWCLAGGDSEGSSGGGGVSMIRGTGASFLGKELLLCTGSGCGGGGASWLVTIEGVASTEFSSWPPSMLETGLV